MEKRINCSVMDADILKGTQRLAMDWTNFNNRAKSLQDIDSTDYSRARSRCADSRIPQICSCCLRVEK